MNRTKHLPTLCAISLACCLSTVSSAQNAQPRLITQPINNSQLVTYTNNTRPEAIPDNDMGPTDPTTPLPGLLLILKRPATTEAAFEQYIANAHNPKSASYHQWLTNAQIGTQYGPATQDISALTSWLSSQGMTVNSINPDGMAIEFSGTVGSVQTAFHTAIHNLSVNGATHMANMNDPAMPAAISGVVGGVSKLNDFMPHPLNKPRTSANGATAKSNGVAETGFISYLGSADLAAIYNFTPLFKAGITGKGQTVVVIEDTDQYSTNDWAVFRKTFGLSRLYPYATLTNVHPVGTMTCGAPGVNGDDGEAAIDADWASSAAPNAAIINAACKGSTQFGGFIALTNLLQQAGHPTIVSISYGEAEARNGAATNLFIYNLYQTAVAEGVSVYVSSGDEGADSSDADLANATHGIGVSGFTSTPYNISVGGTDFGYIPLGTPGTYFTTANATNFQTATGYIPEIPWNDSCGGALISSFLGFPTTGANSLCNSTAFGTPNEFLTTGSGSGGPSNCATGVPANSEVSNGTCKGYPKPSWQSLVGVPADGVRDIPDVSLMASNGFWGTYYDTCWSDPKETADGAAPCGADPSQWAGFGGTSVSSPIWAGIQALVNQDTGVSWGNSNTVLYQLANTEYGAGGNAACNSSLGQGVSSTCVFYDVTQGDMDVNCTPLAATTRRGVVTPGGTFNCYVNGGTYGVLSTSNTVDQPAYGTNVGYDYSTGIGTTNATNLVNAWKALPVAH
jgi:subtilase family serine protease